MISTFGLYMSTSSTRFILLSGVFGFLGVASGAFGAHALKSMLAADLLAIFETGSRYCLHHSMALLATSLYHHHKPNRWLNRACWCFSIGITIFSGTLWVLALSGTRWLEPLHQSVGFLCWRGGAFSCSHSQTLRSTMNAIDKITKLRNGWN